MDFESISKSWNLAYPRVLWAQKTVQEIPELWVKYKKRYWDSKMHPSCLTPFFCQFTIPTLRCHNFWTSYQFVLTLSYLTYTFHLEKFHQNMRWVISSLSPLDMEWPFYTYSVYNTSYSEREFFSLKLSKRCVSTMLKG